MFSNFIDVIYQNYIKAIIVNLR